MADQFPAPVRLLRPADLLDLTFTFRGLKFEDLFRRTLVPAVAGQDGLIVVTLPPQHLAEEAFAEPGGDPAAPPVAARIGGPGQLVFTVGATDKVGYDEAGLLTAMSALPMRVVPVADGPGGAPENPLRDPANNPRTAIELPYRLYLSPKSTDRWAHRTGTPPAQGRVELWHTRLAGITARAVWTRDFTGDTATPPGGAVPPGPFLMSLRPEHRRDFVHLTASHDLRDVHGRPYLPLPVDVQNLMLTSLGGYLDSLGQWWAQRPAGIDILEWRHRAALGRDHFVRVMRAGFLAPFGHRAIFVTITERKFHPDRTGNPAYLRQRQFVIVREPVRRFDPAEELSETPDGPKANHMFPFREVRLLTLVTPDLVGATPEQPFFPATETDKPFLFKAIGVDRNGREVEFRTPLMYLSENLNNAAGLSTVVSSYQAGARTVSLGGQSLAYADSRRVDDTSLDTAELTWEIRRPTQWAALPQDRFARFAPVVAGAKAVVAAASRLAGDDSAVAVGYADAYARAGFPSPGARADAPNKGEVFLEVKGSVALNFNNQRDRSGGLAAPSIEVNGMSRITGPVGGELATAAAGSFDPVKVLDALGAKLFGIIKLSDIVEAAGLDEPLRAPRFLTETVNSVTAFLSDLHRIQELMDLVEQRFGQLADRARAVRDTAREFLTIAGEFLGDLLPLAPPPSIEDVEAKFNAFVTAVRALVAALPVEIDPAVPAFLDRVRAQAATWFEGAGSALSLKDSIIGAAKKFRLPETVNTRLEWEPKVRDLAPLKFGPEGRFAVIVDLRGSLRPDLAVGADVTCSLEDFKLDLLDIILLEFDRIRFLARAGKKPDVEVVFRDVRFQGPLSFVQTLREIIPFDGFSDPPALEVTASGITARYGMPLPSLAIGVFSLENIRLDAHFTLPFIGDSMEVGFAFCRREAPFRLTVAFFGGGGFFGLALSPKGLAYCEGALEFGAAVSMNLGVASGSLSVMAGIYFRIEGDGGVELAGYFRARGEVDVLGLISASIELYLELRYRDGVVSGRATITITIEIAFFSESVEISCEKTFAGAPNSDGARAALAPAPRTLTFAEFMAPYDEPGGLRRDPIAEYCSAFAEGA